MFLHKENVCLNNCYVNDPYHNSSTPNSTKSQWENFGLKIFVQDITNVIHLQKQKCQNSPVCFQPACNAK